MTIQTIRIYPAIGITRVGNAKDDFFIGPERTMEELTPPGGFKNSECEILRQGARFRLYAYDENDDLVEVLHGGCGHDVAQQPQQVCLDNGTFSLR